MPRGQLPKAYLRIDPDIDAKHPDNLADFIRLLCAANRQPRRGTFRSRAVLEALLGKAATRKLVDRRDVAVDEDGTCVVRGWEHWQEGDLDVRERMRRIRAEREAPTRTQPEQNPHNGRTKPALKPSPTSEASGVRFTQPPKPPNGAEPDEFEVLTDRLLGHAGTPRQLRAFRSLGRKVGRERALALGREMAAAELDDRFGALLEQLQAEAAARPKSSRFAYMDEDPHA
jgi:hypothetical protein